MNHTHANCIVCNKSFRTRKRPDRKEPPKFWSKECYTVWKRQNEGSGKVTVKCAACGKEITRWPSQIRNEVFCSKSCANKYNHPQAQSTRNDKGRERIAKPCAHCGKTFYAHPHAVDKYKYCSRKCYNEHRMIDDSHTNFRNRALKAFQHECMICGFSIAVQVHHITPRCEGGTNDIDNASVLCPNHHVMADRGLIPSEQLKALTLSAIAQLPDHLRPSGLQLPDPLGNVQQPPLSAELEPAKKSD